MYWVLFFTFTHFVRHPWREILNHYLESSINAFLQFLNSLINNNKNFFAFIKAPRQTFHRPNYISSAPILANKGSVVTFPFYVDLFPLTTMAYNVVATELKHFFPNFMSRLQFNWTNSWKYKITIRNIVHPLGFMSHQSINSIFMWIFLWKKENIFIYILTNQ